MKKFNLRTKTLFAKYAKPKFKNTLAVMPRPRVILDIGIANNSYAECKAVFPNSVYHGLDYQKIDFKMNKEDRFLLCNLDSDGALDGIPADYDLIIVNHVMEHLTHGREVLSKLCGLLQRGGILYAEFPSIRTAYKRKIGHSYHFHEDPTHKAFYQLEDLANTAIAAGCNVVSCGPVSPPLLKYIISFPRAFYNLIAFHSWSGFVRYLPREIRKIDHIMVIKKDDHLTNK